MKKGLASLAFAAVIGATSYSHAQVVINEFVYDPGGTDSAEYIELYNTSASPVDISGYQVLLVNGAPSTGTAYSTITVPALTTLAANSYYVIGNAATVDAIFGVGTVDQSFNLDNIIQNGAPDAIVLKDAGAARVDSVAYEADAIFSATVQGAETANAIAEGGMGRVVGPGVVGPTAGAALRLPNGADTGSNLLDFVIGPPSPGAANAASFTMPFTDSFTGGANSAWRGAFVAPRVVSGATVLGTASADGGDVLEVADTTGGGDTNFLAGSYNQINFQGEIWIPTDVGSNGWSTGVGIASRQDSTWFSTFTGNGLENGFYLEYQNGPGITAKGLGAHAGEIRFYQAQVGATLNTGATTGIVMTNLGASTSVNKGAWNTFRLVFDVPNNKLYAAINGSTVLYDGVIPAGSNPAGGVVVGFRESSGASIAAATTKRTFVDGIVVNTNTTIGSSVSDWMLH